MIPWKRANKVITNNSDNYRLKGRDNYQLTAKSALEY